MLIIKLKNLYFSRTRAFSKRLFQRYIFRFIFQSSYKVDQYMYHMPQTGFTESIHGKHVWYAVEILQVLYNAKLISMPPILIEYWIGDIVTKALNEKFI